MGKSLKGKELGVGISQRKDGIYTGRFKGKNGKTIQKYFKKLSDCQAWYVEAKYKDEHSNIKDTSSMTFESWSEYWLHNVKAREIKPTTMASYKGALQRIMPYLGDKLISDIKPFDINYMLNDMAKSKSNGTMIMDRTICKSCLEYAYENGLIEKNPVISSTSVKSEHDHIRVLYKDEEIEIINALRKSPYVNIFKLASQTGMRVGEILALTWEDIDFENKLISVTKTVTYKNNNFIVTTPKTKNSIRNVPMTKDAIVSLRDQEVRDRNNRYGTDLVFYSTSGSYIQNSILRYQLTSTCKKLGLEPCSMHSFRHAFATKCIEAGMRPKTLQMILGHSNINLTMNLYVHSSTQSQQNELEKIEDMIAVI